MENILKRFFRFFAVLVILDNVLSPSLSSCYESFANLTLVFGLLPNAGNISVIGVGWFLDLMFVFSLIFSFYCVCIENKKWTWMTIVISLIYNFVCVNYFEAGRNSILYSACFFIAGGLIYIEMRLQNGISGLF